MSIRLTSLAFGIFLIITFVIIGRKFLTSQMVYLQTCVSLIYYLAIQLTLFVGYNDLVMHFFGFLLWIFLLKGEFQKKINYIIMGLIFALVLATRKMGFIYILVFLVIFLSQLLYKNTDKKQLLKNLLILTSSCFLFLCLINFSSLKSGNGLSFDDKILGGPVNWSQWEYHNALLIDDGKQERFHHVNIEETNKYLIKNGKHSLPSTFLEMITFDISFTIKEFLIDVAIATKYFLRQTGFWLFLFSFFFY